MIVWPDRAAILAVAQPLIKKFEGLRLIAYLCPAKVWTLGYGCTHHPDGRAVQEGETITPGDAQAYLDYGTGRLLGQMETDGAITRAPNVDQAAAFLSLAWNVGLGIHDGKKGDLADSTLFADFNAGNDDEAAPHFLDWDKAHVDGVVVVLPGLKSRRTTEMNLFLQRAA